MSGSNDLFRTVYPVVSAEHRDTLMMAAGMREIVEKLKASECVLPGMKMAIALAEAALAKEQVAICSHAYREAAKAGADLAAVSAIYTQSDGRGGIEMLVETEGPAPKGSGE